MGWTAVLSARAAGLLAALLACGWATPAPAQAPVQSIGKAQSNASPAAVRKAGKKRAAIHKKVRPPPKARAGGKHPQASKRRAGKPPLSARSAARRPEPAAAGQARAPLPPVARTLPPLGPERFYPHGIPELRPEFLHPLPDAPVVSEQATAAPREPGAVSGWRP